MPTYQYTCAKCDQEFDFFQSMTEAALTTCPKEACCLPKWGKGKVKRVIGAGAGLIFKGSGFYITDYRSENYKAGAKKESAAASGNSGEKSSGGESKSAAASPAKSEAKPTKKSSSGEK